MATTQVSRSPPANARERHQIRRCSPWGSPARQVSQTLGGVDHAEQSVEARPDTTTTATTAFTLSYVPPSSRHKRAPARGHGLLPGKIEITTTYYDHRIGRLGKCAKLTTTLDVLMIWSGERAIRPNVGQVGLRSAWRNPGKPEQH